MEGAESVMFCNRQRDFELEIGAGSRLSALICCEIGNIFKRVSDARGKTTSLRVSYFYFAELRL